MERKLSPWAESVLRVIDDSQEDGTPHNSIYSSWGVTMSRDDVTAAFFRAITEWQYYS